MIKRYKKKPIEIEVIKWDGNNIEEVKNFMYPVEPIYMPGFKNSNEIIGIETKEGLMVANINDYIIKEPFDKERGFYPCKPEIFEQTYEECE